MISVVIPLYNKAGQIERTLKSVFDQTCQDFEIVIVDDGSTDGSTAVVENIKDARIRLVRQQNAGVSAARNRGIAEAKGEYVALLDADDEWKPGYLEAQMSLVERYPQCSVFATNYEMHDEKGRVTPTKINRLPFDGEDGELTNYFEVASCSNPPICSISIMASREVFQSVGGFPVGIESGEDLLTWARLACKHKIAYSMLPLAVFNIEGYKISDKPKRVPSTNDRVGEILEALYSENNVRGLREYVSHWYRMRANIYMRLRMRRHATYEIFKALKYNMFNVKLYAYLIVNLLPAKLQPY